MFIRVYVPKRDKIREQLAKVLINHELVTAKWRNHKTRTITVRANQNIAKDLNTKTFHLTPLCLSQQEKWMELSPR